MKIYLAARFERHPEMREVRVKLHDLGHEVTSRWIDPPKEYAEVDVSPRVLNETPEVGRPFAEMNIDDVSASDAVVSFTEWPSSTGGRHVEFGIGLALDKRTIVVGPRENVFHTLWIVEHYPDLGSFLRAMEGA